MEKMLKRVGLCSGRRAMDSGNSDSKQNCSSEPSDSNTVYRLEKGSDNKYERKGDAVKDHPLCDVVNSNECFLQHRLAGVVDDSTGVIGGDLMLAEDVDGSDKTGEGIICGQIERRRCWRRSRVLFHFQLDSHIMEFKPRALTKRLCGGKKQDNELYRSNSFKFERFERKDVGPLQKQDRDSYFVMISALAEVRLELYVLQRELEEGLGVSDFFISLCDDYSIPVDFVNKRPHSIGVGLASWSPNGERVEVIETYCDPRDSKAYLRPGDEPSGGKLYTSPDRDYSQPYPKAPSLAPNLTPDEKEIEAHLEEETVTTFVCPEVDDLAASLAAAWAARVAANEGVYEAVGEGVNEGQNSPTETSIQITGGDNDSISGEVQDQEGVSGGTGNQQVLQPNPPQRRHPSPYYYADLFRGAEKELELEEGEERDEEGYSNEADTQRPQKHHHHHHHHRHHHHRHHHHAHYGHHHHHRHRHRFSHLNNEEKVAEGEVNDRSKAGGVPQTLPAGLKSFDAEKDTRPVDKEEEGPDVANDQQLLSFGRSVVEDTLLLRLLSESPSTVGPSLAEVEGIASEGAVIAETAAGGGRDPSGLGESTGGYGGGGGGGPAPAFLAACLLRDWDLIFATPAAVVTAAPRPSTTPGGAKSVAKGLRSCSCRGGRCVTSEEEEEEGEEEDGKAAAEVVGGECCDIATSNALLEEDEEMTGRQRHLYETAFDCKVRRSQDDLDEVDRVSNHPVLRMLPTALARAAAAAVSPRPSRSQAKEANSSTPPKERRKLTLTRGDHKQQSPSLGVHERLKLEDRTNSSSSSTKGNADLKIRDRSTDVLSFQTPPSVKGPLGSGHAPSPPPLRGYAPSPPSTAPLPTKFHNRSLPMNSIRSAPNLPAGGSGANCVPSPARMKDSRLPVKSSRGRHSVDGPILEFKGRPGEEDEMEEEEEEDERIEVQAELGSEGGERRTLVLGRPSRQQYRPNLPTVSAGARPKYSSTESMATSSSAMSSLESLRSSTSEGNRSTSSSGSRRSSSLSSHSSDSGSTRLLDLHRLHLHHLHHHHHHHHQHHGSSQMLPQLGVMGHQGGHPQLHILSPISDKSQEPASETSDNNRNNNSQGASPEERLSSPIMVDNGTVVAATTNTNSLPAPSIPSNLPLSPPQPDAPSSPQTLLAPTPWEVAPKMKRRVLVLQNKNLLNRALVQAAAAAAAAATSSSGETEVQGSDSGISIESSSQGQCSGQGGTTGGRIGIGDENRGLAILGHEELRALPFDMPKLRRRLAADASGSSSTSVASNSRPDDLRALPFDMPKLRRRLRQQQSTDGLEPDVSSGVSQASSSQSVLELDINTQNSGKALVLGPVPGVIPQPQMSIVRPKLTLNLCGQTQGPSLPSVHPRKKRPGLSLELGCSALSAAGEPVDVTIPLERQGWYHGAITRVEAESVLRLTKEGSYLVRNSESTRQDYSLSLKSARGFMHMRIQQNKENRRFILGQFSQPFSSIPDMIHHYTINRLPIKGAEHMCLLHPVIEQLL